MLDRLVETAASLCGADLGHIAIREDLAYRPVATFAMSPELDAVVRKQSFTLDRSTVTGRTALEQRITHIVDMAADPEFAGRETVRVGRLRTALGVPLMRDGEPIGVIGLNRLRVEPFTERQIELVRTFADQAVIAIENTRLLTELRESLEQQQAIAEVLQVINSSPGELQPVFEAMLEKAIRLCEASLGHITSFDGELFHHVATQGEPDLVAFFRQTPALRASSDSITLGRVVRGERFVHIPDCRDTDEYREKPLAREIADRGRMRTLLTVPLRKEDALLGTIHVYRQQVRPFSDKQIALLQNFAAQAVVAMENARLITETREALEQQTATAAVLQVINSSPGNLTPVFEALLEKAMQLCEAAFGGLTAFDGERFQALAMRGLPAEAVEAFRQPWVAGPGSYHENLVQGEPLVHTDIGVTDPARLAHPQSRAIMGIGKARTGLIIALRKDERLLGSLFFYRQEVRPFTDKQIALLQNFAAQAVIAMENARLITETREALERQTATAEILRVISSSPTDVQPTFDAIAKAATTLTGALSGGVFRYDGSLIHFVAHYGWTADQLAAVHRVFPIPPGRGSITARAITTRDVAHLADFTADPDFAHPSLSQGGLNTTLSVPMLRDGDPIGAITITRTEKELFSDDQVDLLKTFADQAVIAIENVRLFNELNERTHDLEESLEYQTATSDVLKIISQSGAELETVLQTLVETAARICEADQGSVFRLREGRHRLVASFGKTAEYSDFLVRNPFVPDRGTLSGRTAIERRIVHIEDAAKDPEYTWAEAQQRGSLRTGLGVPLLREDALIGVLTLYRQRVEPFTDKQIALVTTFADQAVIAIENARLFSELRSRTDELARREAELSVTFDNMGDGVVMFDGELRLAAWNQNFQKTLDLSDEFLATPKTYADYLRHLAERGEFGVGGIEAELSRRIEDTDQELRLERTRPDGRVIEVRRNPVRGGGFVLIYGDVTERKRAEAEIRAARDAAEAALRELQTAQASLLHAQKMAALGQLTAGIAHEIKNPLNFVNNFADLSGELLQELTETTAPALAALGDERRAEVDEVVGMLRGNLDKIAEHGKRADGIVKSMLEHSRGVSGFASGDGTAAYW